MSKGTTSASSLSGAALLRDYVEAKCINVQKFAKRVGVSRTAVYKWMEGSELPTRANARKVHDLTDGAVPHYTW